MNLAELQKALLAAEAKHPVPEDEDPIQYPSSTVTFAGSQIKINHDDGNEWSWGEAVVEEVGPDQFKLVNIYERNEQFFPDKWIEEDVVILLTGEEIVAAFEEFQCYPRSEL